METVSENKKNSRIIHPAEPKPVDIPAATKEYINPRTNTIGNSTEAETEIAKADKRKGKQSSRIEQTIDTAAI
jgi:hypothetical protein